MYCAISVVIEHSLEYKVLVCLVCAVKFTLEPLNQSAYESLGDQENIFQCYSTPQG